MRLAQIARKVSVTPIEIKRFLEREFEISIENDPNFKLEDPHIAAVLNHFEVKQVEEESIILPKKEEMEEMEKAEPVPIPALSEEAAEEKEEVQTEHIDEVLELTAEIDIIETEFEVETAQELDEEVQDEQPADHIDSSNSISIDYDSVSEDTDDSNFKEVPVNRNAETIKAPTVKLDGLKILGKIELPEHKKPVVEPPTAEELAAEEAAEIAVLDAAMRSNVQDIKEGVVFHPKEVETKQAVQEEDDEFSPFKDKNGMYRFSQEQRQNRRKRLENNTDKKRVQAKKENKKRHYADLMAKVDKTDTSKIIKKKKVKTAKTIERKHKENLPEPKGIWEKFKRWLND